MIRSFANRETELVWQGLRSKRLPQDVQRAGLRMLQKIEAAETVDDLREPPGTGWKLSRAIVAANGLSGSITNGVSVFDG